MSPTQRAQRTRGSASTQRQLRTQLARARTCERCSRARKCCTAWLWSINGGCSASVAALSATAARLGGVRGARARGAWRGGQSSSSRERWTGRQQMGAESDPPLAFRSASGHVRSRRLGRSVVAVHRRRTASCGKQAVSRPPRYYALARLELVQLETVLGDGVPVVSMATAQAAAAATACRAGRLRCLAHPRRRVPSAQVSQP